MKEALGVHGQVHGGNGVEQGLHDAAGFGAKGRKCMQFGQLLYVSERVHDLYAGALERREEIVNTLSVRQFNRSCRLLPSQE
ncbi:hypothetical protein [Comamonas composti]|uniref:hypothetical protein n=1 Tax=Comamonas composti TaxID=408558 RepID=UPI001B7FAA52|nr:hypothetical protein [Comamonas composti]